MIDGLSFDENCYWAIVEKQHQVEVAAGDATALHTSDLNDILLQQVQESAYWDLKWQVYTPLPIAGLDPSNPRAIQYMLTRNEFQNFPGSIPTDYAGDFVHLAATIRAYTSWPAPSSISSAAICDLGGWALDLVTAWNDYAELRKAGVVPGGAQGYLQNIIGGSTGLFDIDDLVADVDGYLIGQKLKLNPPPTFSEAMRNLLVNCQIDARWRFNTYFQDRFGGSKSNIISAVHELFDDIIGNFALNIPVNLWINYRKPGEYIGTGDPTGTELASELDAVAAAFATVIYNKATIL